MPTDWCCMRFVTWLCFIDVQWTMRFKLTLNVNYDTAYVKLLAYFACILLHLLQMLRYCPLTCWFIMTLCLGCRVHRYLKLSVCTRKLLASASRVRRLVWVEPHSKSLLLKYVVYDRCFFLMWRWNHRFQSIESCVLPTWNSFRTSESVSECSVIFILLTSIFSSLCLCLSLCRFYSIFNVAWNIPVGCVFVGFESSQLCVRWARVRQQVCRRTGSPAVERRRREAHERSDDD